MIPTPDLSHLTKDDFMRVYEPAEDTFLLLDALEEDVDHLRALKPGVCVEVGVIVTTDINPRAAKCTEATGQQNGVSLNAVVCDLVQPLRYRLHGHVDVLTEATGQQNGVSLNAVVCDLVQPLRYRLHGHVDVLIFNPPYVPTEEEEAMIAQSRAEIAGAWAGGFDGMAVTNRLLDELDSILSPKGCFYLVALKQNNPQGIIDRMRDLLDELDSILSPKGCFYLVALKQNNPQGIIDRMREQWSLDGKVILQRRAGREHLFVLRFTRL
ncbi:unnamed protein product [Rhizoctonia solani]|uniref:Uncharacterized protein n=1 Tax=Rhizoctonia solani TaxID=456999 RepID=A0A8H3HE59_9AGAM|nr:unnamed protein product [Rhizoctonia solani]